MLLQLSRLAVTGLLLAVATGSAISKPRSPFSWDAVEPSEDLRYHDCLNGFQCARLSVPLDWLNPDGEHKIAIAIVKRPARVPETDPSFGGSLFVNPGGPGQSGVGTVFGAGPLLQGVLDGEKHYEIIGFDPRGIGFTTPAADCNIDRFVRAADKVQAHSLGHLVPENEKLAWLRELNKEFWRKCEDTLGQEGGILNHMTTASVARDMLEIVERIEDLRAEKTGRGASSGDRPPPRLQYLGFSYGTVLGNTFASMFPGRVERMILDSVVDIDDYMTGTWMKNLQDAESILDHYYKTCFDMGARCLLNDGSDDSWEDLKTRVNKAIAALGETPYAIDTNSGTYLLDDTDVAALLFTGIFRPPILDAVTTGLYGVLHGDRDLLRVAFRIVGTALRESCPPCGKGRSWKPLSPDAKVLISCSDGPDVSGLEISDWKEYFSQQRNQSSMFGAGWAPWRFDCVGRTSQAKHRFVGPFETPEANTNITEGAPASPLLFLSSRLDPVTPLANAFEMSARHPGSSVVVQNSMKHGALVTQGNHCTRKIVREYLDSGRVPESGTFCDVPECASGLFGKCDADVEKDEMAAVAGIIGEGMAPFDTGLLMERFAEIGSLLVKPDMEKAQ